MQSLSTESEQREKPHTFVNTASRKNGILGKKGDHQVVSEQDERHERSLPEPPLYSELVGC
jgi:hypothetical protein